MHTMISATSLLFFTKAQLQLKSYIEQEQNLSSLLGYEPADLTVHPPPQNDREWVHFFRMGV